MPQRRKYTWNRQEKGWVRGLYKVLAIFLTAVALTTACVIFFKVKTIQSAKGKLLDEGGLKEGQSDQLDLTVSKGKGYFQPDES